MDIVYGQDGLPVDDDIPLKTELGRPMDDRTRIYLASSQTGECRGKVGFIGQCNFRPSNVNSLNLLTMGSDTQTDVSGYLTAS